MAFSWGFSIVMFVACWSVVVFHSGLNQNQNSNISWATILSQSFQRQPRIFLAEPTLKIACIMFSTSILGFQNSLCEYLYRHFWIGRRFSGRWSLDRQLFINLPRRLSQSKSKQQRNDSNLENIQKQNQKDPSFDGKRPCFGRGWPVNFHRLYSLDHQYVVSRMRFPQKTPVWQT